MRINALQKIMQLIVLLKKKQVVVELCNFLPISSTEQSNRCTNNTSWDCQRKYSKKEPMERIIGH